MKDGKKRWEKNWYESYLTLQFKFTMFENNYADLFLTNKYLSDIQKDKNQFFNIAARKNIISRPRTQLC